MGRIEKTKTILRQFGETTSVKGVKRALTASRLGIRVMWTFAVLAGLALAIYNITYLLIAYFSYSTVTTISDSLESTATFPDVTICNLNPLSMNVSAMTWDSVKKPMSLWDYTELLEDLEFAGLTRRIKDTFPDMRDGYWREIEGQLASLSGYVENLNDDAVEVIRHHISKNMIQSCHFYNSRYSKIHQLSCSIEKGTLKSTLRPEYISCYTVTPNVKNLTDVAVEALGMILYVDDLHYSEMPVFKSDFLRSKASGVRVVLHQNGTIPNLKQGFSVRPGVEAEVKLEAVETEIEGEPYTKCTSQTHLASVNGFSSRDNEELTKYIYSAEACLSSCYQGEIIRNCGCKDPFLTITESMGNTSIIPFCHNIGIAANHDWLALDSKEAILDEFFPHIVKAVNRTMCASLLHRHSKDCDCAVPCSSQTYEYSLSETKWPHKNYELSFYESHIKDDPLLDQFFKPVYGHLGRALEHKDPAKSAKAWKELREATLIRDNYLKLEVHFAHGGMRKIHVKPAVTFDMLFGSLGGNLNLWIGISFFTLIELAELFINLLSTCLLVGNNQVVVLEKEKNLNSRGY